VTRPLIKSYEAAGVGVRIADAASPIRLASKSSDPEPDAAEAEIAKLVAALEQQEEAIVQLRRDRDLAAAEGERKGREAGLKEAADRQTEMIDALEKGVAAAVINFDAALARTSDLAIAIAHEALAKILGDPAPYSDMTARIITDQLLRLNGQKAVQVRVSAADFPHAEQLETLGVRTGSGGLEMVSSPRLKPGECEIQLSLGSLEVGAPQQWSRLSGVLREAAEGPAEP
jgi:flagellar biosynthesis/type III secretory pathway protein FliH